MSVAISSRESSVFSMYFLCFILERRYARGGCGILDRHRESDTDEDRLFARVEDPGDDAHHFAVGREKRPARASRVRGCVELDEVGQQAFAFGRAVFAAKARDHTRSDRRSDAERKAD